MGIQFESRMGERGQELFLRAQGADRPNIIAEVTGFLEAEGLYVSSIGFNLTSPEQDHFSMELVGKGPETGIEKCHEAFNSETALRSRAEGLPPKIRWARASMFHIGLNTPDRAGIVAAISRVVGGAGGTFVSLLGIIENSGDSAEGGTPHFRLRANVAAESPQASAAIMERLKNASVEQSFGNDLWVLALDQPPERP